MSDFLPSSDSLAEYPVGSPIPTDLKIPSERQFCDLYEKWGNRVIVGHYQQLHPGEKKVARFLVESFGYLGGLTQQATYDFNAHAEVLEQSGVQDPAFFLMAGLLRLDVASKERLLSAAISGFEKGDYSPFLLFLSAANLSKSLADRRADPQLIAANDQIALRALEKGLDPEIPKGRIPCAPVAAVVGFGRKLISAPRYQHQSDYL